MILQISAAKDLITRALQENENLATMTALDDARLRRSKKSVRDSAFQHLALPVEVAIIHRCDVERRSKGWLNT